MTTDLREGIKTKEEYQTGASLSYNPVILALSKKNEVALNQDVFKYKMIDVEKDSITAEILTKEATEKKHIKASKRERTFNAYAKGAKYTQSLANGSENLQKLHNDILREYFIYIDRDGIAGAGGNNGLINSSDPFYVTNESVAIPASTGTGFNRVNAMKSMLVDLRMQVNKFTASSNLVIFYWGEDLVRFLSSVTEGNESDVMDVVSKAFKNKQVDWVEIPAMVLPSDAGNGFVVCADDLVVLDHTLMPAIKSQGTNEEDEYYYANYAYGSLQVTPEVEGAIIKQPVTFSK